MKPKDDGEKHLERMRRWVKWQRYSTYLLRWGILAAVGVWATIYTQATGRRLHRAYRMGNVSGGLGDAWARQFRQPWLAFAIGAVLGLPWVMCWKWLLRKHGRSWAKGMVRRQISPRRNLLMGLGFAVSVGLCSLAACCAAYLLKVAFLPALVGVWVPAFLLHPEVKEFHKAAGRALAELERELHEAESGTKDVGGSAAGAM